MCISSLSWVFAFVIAFVIFKMYISILIHIFVLLSLKHYWAARDRNQCRDSALHTHQERDKSFTRAQSMIWQRTANATGAQQDK